MRQMYFIVCIPSDHGKLFPRLVGCPDLQYFDPLHVEGCVHHEKYSHSHDIRHHDKSHHDHQDRFTGQSTERLVIEPISIQLTEVTGIKRNKKFNRP